MADLWGQQTSAAAESWNYLLLLLKESEIFFKCKVIVKCIRCAEISYEGFTEGVACNNSAPVRETELFSLSKQKNLKL